MRNFIPGSVQWNPRWKCCFDRWVWDQVPMPRAQYEMNAKNYSLDTVHRKCRAYEKGSPAHTINRILSGMCASSVSHATVDCSRALAASHCNMHLAVWLPNQRSSSDCTDQNRTLVCPVSCISRRFCDSWYKRGKASTFVLWIRVIVFTIPLWNYFRSIFVGIFTELGWLGRQALAICRTIFHEIRNLSNKCAWNDSVQQLTNEGSCLPGCVWCASDLVRNRLGLAFSLRPKFPDRFALVDGIDRPSVRLENRWAICRRWQDADAMESMPLETMCRWLKWPDVLGSDRRTRFHVKMNWIVALSKWQSLRSN